MRIVTRENLDTEQWDALVSRFPETSFFSYSWYLDAVAENWCVLVNDDYSTGIALPYSKKLAVKILYTPIFGRYVTPYGIFSKSDRDLILAYFSVRELATSIELFKENILRVHQIIPVGHERKLSSQGKRTLSKATKKGLSVHVHEDYAKIIPAIKNEITGKFKGVNAKSLARLEQLFKSASKRNKIKVFEVTHNEESGGIVCLYDEHQVLYVKGACPENLKLNGGMYLALNQAIEFASDHGLLFDFGGSNVEGVKRFNHNLGGIDTQYFFHQKDEGPAMFKFARKLKKRIG